MLWKEDYEIGVEHIDKQHKGLFDVTARILKILEEEDSERNRRACIETIKYLKSYTLEHFADEEEYQRSIGYERYHQHKQRHDNFAKSVVRMEQEMQQEDFSHQSVEKFIGAITSWLVHHITSSDQDIVGKLPAMDNRSQREPRTIMRQIIARESKAIIDEIPILRDRNYTGEFSGSEQFIIVDCETAGGQNIRALTAIDIKLKLSLAHGILGGMVHDDGDVLVSTTVNNLFGQIVTRFAEMMYVPDSVQTTKIYEMKHREILPFIPKDTPMLSLLFECSKGTYVMRVWTQS